MTTRERVLNILNYEPCDRLPAVHFGYCARSFLPNGQSRGKSPQIWLKAGMTAGQLLTGSLIKLSAGIPTGTELTVRTLD